MRISSLRKSRRNSRSLLNLVNNILFLSRLDAGMIELNKSPIDIAGIFEGRCQARMGTLPAS
jgi:hypothetical protein